MAKELSANDYYRKASRFINNFNKSFFYDDNYKNDIDVLEFKKSFYEVSNLCEGFIDVENVQDEVKAKAAELFRLQSKIKHKINLFKTLTKSKKTLKFRTPKRFDPEKTGHGHEEIGSIRSVSKNVKNKNK